MATIRKPRTEAQKAARRLREGSTAKKCVIRTRGYPPVNMKNHLTGTALVEYIRAFDRKRSLRGGNIYCIGGKEVRV